MKRKCILAISVAMLMMITLPVGTTADVEDNGSFDNAENIPIPGIVQGTLNFTDEDDIYRIQVLKGQTVYVTVDPNETLGVNLYLYMMVGSGGPAQYLEVAADRAPTIGVSEDVPRSVNYTTNSAADEYWMYIWVGNYKGDGSYELRVSINSQDDAGMDTDAGDTYEGATTITAGEYTGFLANADDEDIYKIELKKGDSIYVDLVPESTISINLHLLRQGDNNGLPVYNEVDKHKRTGDEGRGEKRHVEYSLDSIENTTWMHIRLYRDQDMGNYSLNVHVDSQNDGNSGTDAPDTNAGPYGISVTGEYPGTLIGLDTLDFYTSPLTDREILEINITPEASASLAVTLLIDDKQVAQDKARNPEHELGMVRSVNYTMPRTHDDSVAVLKIELDAGKGNYTIKFTLTPKPEDTEAPVVVLVDPEPNSLVKNKREYEFKGTATDFNEIVMIEVSLDKILWENTTLVGDYGQYDWNLTVRFPKSGNNTIYIRATDDQGNQDITTFYVRFKRDKSSPGFEAIALVVALVIGLVVMGRRTRK